MNGWKSLDAVFGEQEREAAEAEAARLMGRRPVMGATTDGTEQLCQVLGCAKGETGHGFDTLQGLRCHTTRVHGAKLPPRETPEKPAPRPAPVPQSAPAPPPIETPEEPAPRAPLWCATPWCSLGRVHEGLHANVAGERFDVLELEAEPVVTAAFYVEVPVETLRAFGTRARAGTGCIEVLA